MDNQVLNPLVADEVARALATPGMAVVALESTILCHGMPWPQNVDVALSVEKAVRDAGAVPATIAIIGGRPRVGLSRDEIVMLGKEGASIRKVSRRDLSYVLSSGVHGATTVSSTMFIAHLVGVRVFVTGGIGGVHRGGETTMDVSTDLKELGRTPVAVICAGVKSILDIPKTLEYLETEGVPAIAYGQDQFPSFFTSDSGFRAPLRLDSALSVARLIHAQTSLGLGGCLLAVPIPKQFEADAADVERSIDQALGEAVSQGITGNAITPFILARVKDLTKGKSLQANIHLVRNNAKVGAQVALELANLSRPRL
eukprot:CAMPEP_0198241480 /NCGR_PEP_ID=MMETSP1446-20131203/6300_1 /TAXON_ID=1461542 ORGANISM="Unidentified sp, Strain CCMP2111" /NCGR_SAMPLE_ID=MMETSP1446 /ASSEMBLY_ACC=CAM_ASM_001112 /LENGTH=312 /DNA_ID=CAMNT_0043924335 /DNA_START=353 /DNA_END=1291 /DNA_ORIENTATION=-